jgi:chemotaxis protein MotA
MELGSLVGFILVLVGIFLGALLKGADIVMLFTTVPALLIVIVGSLGAVMLSHPMAETAAVVKAIIKAFMPGPQPEPAETIEKIVELANRARSEGLLALEEETKKIQDPFFRKGLQLAVDGTDPEILRDTLESEVHATNERHKASQQWLTNIGVFCPTYGIIGAVFGLMAAMGKLDKPEELGHAIAAAFVATFWGVFLANGLYLPLAAKLKRMSVEEAHVKQITIEGVMAIQAGVAPRAVGEMLRGYLPPGARKED